MVGFQQVVVGGGKRTHSEYARSWLLVCQQLWCWIWTIIHYITD